MKARLLAVWVVTVTAAAGAVPERVPGKFRRRAGIEYKLGGIVGERLKANVENWELRAVAANPAMLRMFYDRERKPGRNPLPWHGEFVGKYLSASILSHRMLRDARQKRMIDTVVDGFLKSQGADGYLGPFDSKQRLTGKNWDIWGHYWAIRALLLYDEEFGSSKGLEGARRAADLLVEKFLNRGIRLTNDESFGQMNYAVIHAFTKLYRVTGKQSYLDMARWVVEEWDKPGAGLYIRYALAGKEMFEFPGNRWESLHDFQGMADLYRLTGEARLDKVFRHIWTSILKGDRHNTGGFTSGERTTGNPYDGGAIETCCTVAWVDMSVDMLQLTGNSLVADEIELSTYNGLFGAQHPSGSWWTYNTPMDGERRASAHSIVFQARAGSPELNCCSVNAPRGIGLLTEWALLAAEDGVVLNYYGPGTMAMPLESGQKLTVEQTTRYPAELRVAVKVGLARSERMALYLRIPAWSAKTKVTVNGAAQQARAGTYLRLERDWKDGDTVQLEFDEAPHFWMGEREMDGKGSVYYGPLLLAWDPTYNEQEMDIVPELDARTLRLTREGNAGFSGPYMPWVLFTVAGKNGAKVTLCDFATAGAYGNQYRTWFAMTGVEPLKFVAGRPVWVNRPGAR